MSPEVLLKTLSPELSVGESSLPELVCNYGILEKTDLAYVNWDLPTEHAVTSVPPHIRETA